MTNLRHLFTLLIAAGATMAVTTPAAHAAPTPQPLAPRNTRPPATAEAKRVDSQFSDEQLDIMARSAGRSVAQQKAYLTRQADQNNAYAELSSQHSFDGAYFTDDGQLVVQAPANSPAARAAQARGLQVRTPQQGERRLNELVDEVTAMKAPGMITAAPDLPADKVVVTSSDPAATRAALARFGTGVEVRQGEKMVRHIGVAGGDKVTMSASGGGYCSAGFPAKTSNGSRLMIWVGHCLEGKTSFFKGGTRIGTFAAGQFTSYDGQPDRDLGAMWIDNEDQMTTAVNSYGATVSQADRGA